MARYSRLRDGLPLKGGALTAKYQRTRGRLIPLQMESVDERKKSLVHYLQPAATERKEERGGLCERIVHIEVTVVNSNLDDGGRRGQGQVSGLRWREPMQPSCKRDFA